MMSSCSFSTTSSSTRASVDHVVAPGLIALGVFCQSHGLDTRGASPSSRRSATYASCVIQMSRGTRSGSCRCTAAFTRSRLVIVFAIEVSRRCSDNVFDLSREARHVVPHGELGFFRIAAHERLDQLLVLVHRFFQAALLLVQV